MKQTIKVIMLPTEDKTSTNLFRINKNFHSITKEDELGEVTTPEGSLDYDTYDESRSFHAHDAQHLYFVLVENAGNGMDSKKTNCVEIGEYAIDTKLHLMHTESYCNKIIASTDKSLGLPSIPKYFIKAYVMSQGEITRRQVIYDHAGNWTAHEVGVNAYTCLNCGCDAHIDTGLTCKCGESTLRTDDDGIVIHKPELYTEDQVKQYAFWAVQFYSKQQMKQSDPMQFLMNKTQVDDHLDQLF